MSTGNNGLLQFSGQANPLTVKQWTTLERPTPVGAGVFAFNTTTGRYEFSLSDGTWVNHVRLSGDTMTGNLQVPNLIITGGGYIRPSIDSTGAILFTKADGTTGILKIDTTNKKLIFTGDANLYYATDVYSTASLKTDQTMIIGGNGIQMPNTAYITFGTSYGTGELNFANGTTIVGAIAVSTASFAFNLTAKFTSPGTNSKASVFIADPSQNVNLSEWQNSSGSAKTWVGKDFSFTIGSLDSGTNAVLNALVVGHNSSAGASVAAGYGTGILVQGQDNNNANVNMFVVESSYTTATDASYATKTIFSAYDKSGGKRNALQLTANGSRPIAYTFPGTQTTTLAALGGSIFDDFADVGNSTTTETDIYTHSITGNTLATNGDALEYHVYGTSAGSATATTQLKVYFGGTVVADTGAIAISTSDQWHIHVLVIRDSSTSVRVGVDIFFSGGVTFTASPFYATVTGLTLSSSQTSKVTATRAGVGAATNDILTKLAKTAYRSAI